MCFDEGMKNGINFQHWSNSIRFYGIPHLRDEFRVQRNRFSTFAKVKGEHKGDSRVNLRDFSVDGEFDEDYEKWNRCSAFAQVKGELKGDSRVILRDFSVDSETDGDCETWNRFPTFAQVKGELKGDSRVKFRDFFHRRWIQWGWLFRGRGGGGKSSHSLRDSLEAKVECEVDGLGEWVTRRWTSSIFFLFAVVVAVVVVVVVAVDGTNRRTNKADGSTRWNSQPMNKDDFHPITGLHFRSKRAKKKERKRKEKQVKKNRQQKKKRKGNETWNSRRRSRV